MKEPSDYQVQAVLKRHGYEGAGYSRMCLPGHPNEGNVIVLDKENVAFHFSPDSPLHRPDGHGGTYPVTPFDVLVVYECGGDYELALEVAKRKLNSRVMIYLGGAR